MLTNQNKPALFQKKKKNEGIIARRVRDGRARESIHIHPGVRQERFFRRYSFFCYHMTTLSLKKRKRKKKKHRRQ